MSDDNLRADSADSSDGPESPDVPENDDPFAPERVDEATAARLEAHEPLRDADTRLVVALARSHALPPEAEASLARVRARVWETRARPAATRNRSRERIMRRGALVSLPHAPVRGGNWLSAAMRAGAAVLVVALLGGGFFAVLHGRANFASRSDWRDVSITHARLARQLDFDASHGLVYAVSKTGSAIYACDANHLWYSTDDGRSYAPFPLAYPASNSSQPDELCSIGTAPGAPGIFVVTYGPATQIATQIWYAAAGDSGWRALGISDTAVDIGTGRRVPSLAASDIAQAVSSASDHARLRVVGNWLFVLAQAPNERLVATPDFGTTWYQLDTPLEAQNLQCAAFAVDPANPLHLVCDAAPQPGFTADAVVELSLNPWETHDGGKTWSQIPYQAPVGQGWPPVTSVLASAHYLYASEILMHLVWLLRRPIAGGAWQQVAQLPQPIDVRATGSTAVLSSADGETYDAAPDGTLYVWQGAHQGDTVTTQVFALRPGASSFDQIGSQKSLAYGGRAPVLELGDVGPGGSPALYLHDQPASANSRPQPLYRLALPGGGANTSLDTTPLPMPAPTASATPIASICKPAPGNLADIQPGGFGATVDTFDTRWGQHHGAAAGSIFFGPNTSAGAWVVQAVEPASNNRIYNMSYRVDPAKQTTLAQAEALARTIVPKDAVQTTPPHQTPYGIEADYCSAALVAAFPSSVAGPILPLQHTGRLVVLYTLDAGGNVVSIDFSQVQS